jgi:hypothetical protein
MIYVKSVADDVLLITDGERRCVTYSPSKQIIVTELPIFEDTGSRLVVDLERGLYVVGGWESDITYFSLTNGVTRVRESAICRMDSVSCTRLLQQRS